MNGADPGGLLAELMAVRERVIAEGADIQRQWDTTVTRESFRESAANLARFLAYVRFDLRPLQAGLAPWGLASLDRVERSVIPSLDAIITSLQAICGTTTNTERPTPFDLRASSEILARQTAEVFGPVPEGRFTRIMVTLAPADATDIDHVRGLFRAGMDVARINCGRDMTATWEAMIDNVRHVGREFGRDCRVLMDLGGPKIRTRQVLTPKKRKRVVAGDRILLTYDEPRPDPRYPFQAGCTLPKVLHQVRKGAQVSIRDGLISGTVEDVVSEGVVMMVVRTPPNGQPLQPQRGINFPGTALDVSPLTDSDIANLDFVCERADIVGYSFVQRPEDIARLQAELATHRPGGPPMPIVAKVETELAFANLPELIFQAAGSNPFSVMIARGDLAVETGYERMSELQEAILWLCDSAHIPVIWATQVLESLVKKGMPSRGEFTDAAMAERAECVMLNKGKHIAEGIAVLDNVLRRMESHRAMRSALLGPTHTWAVPS